MSLSRTCTASVFAYKACFALILNALLAAVVGWQPGVPVDWRRLDGPGHIRNGLGRFDDTDYAFPVTDNLKYCRKNIVDMPPPNVNVTNYGWRIEKALSDLNKKGGGTLRLQAGVYYIKTQFEVPSYTCLQGAGMYKTTLRVHPDAPEFRKAGMLRTTYTTHVSLFDFTQDGNRYDLYGDEEHRFGIYTHVSTYVWMKNVRVMRNKMYGFDPHGANTAWGYYLVIEDCLSLDNGKDGFTIDQYYYVSILNSVAVDNDRHGFNVVSGSKYVLVKGNKAKDNILCSLSVQNNEFGTRSTRFVSNIGIGHRIAGICVRNTIEVEAMRNKMYSGWKSTSMYELKYVTDVKLAENEWIRTQGVSDTMFKKNGNNLYAEWDTRVVDVTEAVRQRYFGYFADINQPPEGIVQLDGEYGKGKGNNRMPNVPTQLRLRTNEEPLKKIPRRRDKHDQFGHPKSNNPLTSDPKCEKGIRNGLFCCPLWCVKCHTSNCPTKAAACCPSSIRHDASSCDTFPPPCYLSRKFTAEGRLFGPKEDR